VQEPPALKARNLDLPGVRHAFFTREGGVSEGVYGSLNGGVGSKDAPEKVAENRARMAKRVGVAPERLLVPFQIHSADALTISQPWSPEERPRCDGLVTRQPSLALGVTGADCGMLLFADARAGAPGAPISMSRSGRRSGRIPTRSGPNSSRAFLRPRQISHVSSRRLRANIMRCSTCRLS